MADNNSLYSVHQPVVERQNFTLDVATSPGGLAVAEQARLNGWFETMDLRYGDRIAIENPGANPAVTNAVSELAARYGLIISETAPTTSGFVQPGQARVVLTRSDRRGTRLPRLVEKVRHELPQRDQLQLWLREQQQSGRHGR